MARTAAQGELQEPRRVAQRRDLAEVGGGVAPILEKAARRNGSLGPFETLLRASSLNSNSAATEVLASRVW